MDRGEAKLRRDALRIFQAALKASDAGEAVRRHLAIDRGILKVARVRLPLKNFDRIFLVAAGKAAIPMTTAIGKISGSRLVGGIAVTKHGHAGPPLHRVRLFEAEHPIPGPVGIEASHAIRTLLQELNARDLLLVAISGGASALLPAPADPVTLAAKQKTTDLLLRCGADIVDLNIVRKHLSFLKGGRLAALAYPASVVGLLLSDVIGDALDVIGSGPTVPDSSTFRDAIGVLEKFHLLNRVPALALHRLAAGERGEIPETPKPGDPAFRNVHNVVIGSNRLALDAAARQAKELGYRPLILSTSMQGEAREVARVHAAILREIAEARHPVAAPACVLSGGETTVTVRGQGKGGRNQEFALAAAAEIANCKNVLVLSAGTDGTDGPTDAAGAIATPTTAVRARKQNIDLDRHLADNNAYPFFDALGDLVKTGPTGTNVMDIHLLLAASS